MVYQGGLVNGVKLVSGMTLVSEMKLVSEMFLLGKQRSQLVQQVSCPHGPHDGWSIPG